MSSSWLYTWMYSIFHPLMCDAHIAEIKNFLLYSKRQFWKAVLPPHRSAKLTIGWFGTLSSRRYLFPRLYERENVTSANASLYRARYYKLWRNGRARNDNTKKRLLGGLPQLHDATGRDLRKMQRENESWLCQTDYPVSRRIIRTDCVRTAVRLD